MTAARSLLFFVLIVGISGCANLDQFLRPPSVTVTKVEMLPFQGLQPRFAISLNVVNPNPISIPITGLAYQISLNGHPVFSGATSDVPTIPSYEEVAMEIEVGTNLVESIGFVSSLLGGEFDRLEYQIDSDINVRGIPRPFQVSESGEVDFGTQ